MSEKSRSETTRNEKKPGLEENFKKLEEIMERLEEDIPLEEAFDVYSEGMAVLKLCNEQIDRVEKQVLKLGEDGQLEEFMNGNAGF